MDRIEIMRALTALGRRLADRNVVGELYVVGGAAIALAFDERRATRDVDGVFEPKLIVYEEAAVVADELGLPDGWLNDSVKDFLAGPDPWRSSRAVRPRGAGGWRGRRLLSRDGVGQTRAHAVP